MKTFSLLAVLSFSMNIYAGDFFPGSTLDILEDAPAVRIEDQMLASPLLTYAIFEEGRSLSTIPAMTPSTLFCLLAKDKGTSSLKGHYVYNGYGFSQYNSSGAATQGAKLSCFKTRFNSYNSKYIPEPINLGPEVLEHALGGMANVTSAQEEKISVGKYSFTTGTSLGKEVYGQGRCSLITFKVNGIVKMLFGGPRASCSMNAESANVERKDRGDVLKIKGNGQFIGVNTTCSLEFDLKGGALNGKVLSNIDYNHSGDYCQF